RVAATARIPSSRTAWRRWSSHHRLAVRSGVAAGHEVLQLPLDVGQERTSPKPEEDGPEPAVAQLFLHKDQPVEGLFGGPNAAGRLEADGRAGARLVLADHGG